MILCHNCSRQIEDASKFCKYCGNLIGSRRVLSIGKHEDNDIVVSDPRVSRYHAVLIRAESGGYIIRDLGSKNGTFLDGEPVVTAHVGLSSEISIGPCPLDRPSIESRGGTGNLWLMIGKHPTNDFVLSHPMVSRHHLAARHKADGYFLLDLNSTNGTFVNGRLVRWCEAQSGDAVRLGDCELDLGLLIPIPRQPAGTRGTVLDVMPVALEKNLITVGRTSENDVIIDHPQVSKRHAHFLREGDHYVLEDLGSHNGTFLNGVRVKGRVLVDPSDQVKIGGFLLSIDPAGLTKATYRGGTVLQASDLVKCVRAPGGDKVLIDQVSLTVYSHELVALMGPAGAGKTTLMMCLNGYSRPTGGFASINGKDLYANYESFRGSIGYVPQEDIVHKELTSYEALYYTAKLRLPRDTSDQEIDTQIDRWLHELDIYESRDVIIGDGTPEMKGISGGQRKRVNLCLELLTEPDVLFLDEPTSGLDHINTRSVMYILRRLADAGRVIILTIHQPAEEFFRLTDNLILLERGGKIAYYGPSADALEYFAARGDVPAEGANPAEYVFEALKDQDDPEFFQSEYRNSAQHREYVDGRKKLPAENGGGKKTLPRRPGIWQWWILTRRYFRIKLRDRTSMSIMLAQAPIVGVLILLAFGIGDEPDPATALLFLSVSAVWFGCSNAAREVVSERAIYFRERMVNLKIPSYILSKVGFLSLLSAFQCLVLVGIPYWFIGVSGDPMNYVKVTGVLTLASVGGLTLGLVLSSFVRSNEAAIAMVPIVMIPQIILGGGILPLKDMGDTTLAVAGLMVTRWAFEASMIIESPETQKTIQISGPVVQTVSRTAEPRHPRTTDWSTQPEFRWVERDTTITVKWVEEIGVDTGNLEIDLAGLSILTVSFFLLILALMRLKDTQ